MPMFSTFFAIYKNLLVDQNLFRRAQFTPWQNRPFPPNFRRNRRSSNSSKKSEPLVAEQLQDTKQLTHGSLSLFDFEPGQYERSMGINPVTGVACFDDDC
jgi:hypothetical protein